MKLHYLNYTRIGIYYCGVQRCTVEPRMDIIYRWFIPDMSNLFISEAQNNHYI